MLSGRLRIGGGGGVDSKVVWVRDCERDVLVVDVVRALVSGDNGAVKVPVIDASCLFLDVLMPPADREGEI